MRQERSFKKYSSERGHIKGVRPILLASLLNASEKIKGMLIK
jgi:hypothetical protein